MKLNELYDAYAAVEQLPVDARAADATELKRRTEILRSVDERETRAKAATEAATAKVRLDLRTEAQAASACGAIPGRIAASGGEPKFASVRSATRRLEALLKEQSHATQGLERLQSDLASLEKRVHEEVEAQANRGRARAADFATSVVGALAVSASLIAGPGLVGVGVLTVGFAAVGIRLMNRKSALMAKAAGRRPAIASLPGVRAGYILMIIGWGASITQIVDIAGTIWIRSLGIHLAFGDHPRDDVSLQSWVALVPFIMAIIVGRAKRGKA